MDDERLLTLNELASLLHVSRTTLYRMLRRGDAPPAVRLSSGARRWRRATVEAWLAEREQGQE